MVSIEQAGHFQFLDKQSSMQRAVCAQGKVPDYSVRQISQVSTAQQCWHFAKARELNAMQLVLSVLLR